MNSSWYEYLGNIDEAIYGIELATHGYQLKFTPLRILVVKTIHKVLDSSSTSLSLQDASLVCRGGIYLMMRQASQANLKIMS